MFHTSLRLCLSATTFPHHTSLSHPNLLQFSLSFAGAVTENQMNMCVCLCTQQIGVQSDLSRLSDNFDAEIMAYLACAHTHMLSAEICIWKRIFTVKTKKSKKERQLVKKSSSSQNCMGSPLVLHVKVCLKVLGVVLYR